MLKKVQAGDSILIIVGGEGALRRVGEVALRWVGGVVLRGVGGVALSRVRDSALHRDAQLHRFALGWIGEVLGIPRRTLACHWGLNCSPDAAGRVSQCKGGEGKKGSLEGWLVIYERRR